MAVKGQTVRESYDIPALWEKCKNVFHEAGYATFEQKPDYVGYKPKVSGDVEFSIREAAMDIRETNQAFKETSLPEKDTKQPAKEMDKSVFTSRFVKGGWEIEEALEYIIESGRLNKAIKELYACSQYGPDWCEAFMTYNYFIVAKGWVAERIMSEHMSKGTERQDKGGIDFYDSNTTVQLKSWRFGMANSNPDEINGHTVVYYGFSDGMFYWDTDYRKVTDKIQEDFGNINKNTIKSYDWLKTTDF